jgi:hypothetical protein
MDPFTLIMAAVAGGGELFKGFANSQAAELQGKIAAGNTRLLNEQAQVQELGGEAALAKGAFEQTRLADKVSRTIAGQRAGFATSGLTSTGPSPLLQAAFSAQQGETDLGIIRANAALERAGALTNAANTYGRAANSAFEEQAAESKRRTSLIAGIFGAGTAFLKAGAGGGGGSFGGGGGINLGNAGGTGGGLGGSY